MRNRDARADQHPVLATLVLLFVVAVIAGIGYLWHDFNGEITQTSASAGQPAAGATASGSRAPSASPSVSDSPETSPGSRRDSPLPSFDPIKASEGRAQPLVLLVGDGYAAGVGASSTGTSYASLLARDLDWDVRLAVQAGAGYTKAGADGQTVPELYAAANPKGLAPDAVIVQAGYGGDYPDADVAAAIAELGDLLRAELPGVPVIAIGSFWPGIPTAQSQARDQTIATAWSEQEGVLFLRPQAEGWSDFKAAGGGPDDAGHALIAASIESDLRDAGLL